MPNGLTREDFLPVCKEDMRARSWYWYDFLLVSGDAYVDHPSFGAAVIARVLEKHGFRVAIAAQPDWSRPESLAAFGRPRLGALVTSGSVDSMVAHYTVAKRRRTNDAYTPGGVFGKRPDRAVIVYTNLVKQAFPALPVILGGLEASLRRFAHYDYWDDRVRRPILVESGADLLVYGMGEGQITEIARRLRAREAVERITDVRGTCFCARTPDACAFEAVTLPSFAQVCASGRDYAAAAMTEQDEQDHVRGRALLQECDDRYVVQNPPAPPPEGGALDAVFELPYTRTFHPDYAAAGGVPAIEEVRFSIIHNRGCFGACHFCALAMHQGRYVTARGHDSVLREARRITAEPDFKGYIHDVGGPTANFRRPACPKQKTEGACLRRQCLFPTPCPSLDADHSDYLALLRKLRALPGVKKVFVRSGIRYDFLLQDKSGEFFAELVRHHVSGQLKVAPEHIAPGALHAMGKPHGDVFERFAQKFYALCERCGKEQYLVPYLMSSHPGCTLGDAVALAEYLKQRRLSPEQVQDFYPTPGTLSTAMYYTGLDPRTMKPVFVPREAGDKAMQRALLQPGHPKNRALVVRALTQAGREDLIGGGKHCLVRGPGAGAGAAGRGAEAQPKPGGQTRSGRPKTSGRTPDAGPKTREPGAPPKTDTRPGTGARRPQARPKPNPRPTGKQKSGTRSKRTQKG